ncbi:MAG: nucleotide exchange factor GrpE [Noviherbaspirillum sp.]
MNREMGEAGREGAEAEVLTPVQETDAEAVAQQKLAELETKFAEMQDAFLRARADGENIRRRAQDDIARAHKFAIESFAETLMPVKDSLEMALKVEAPTLESLREGVEMTLRQLSSAFEKGRLVEIDPKPGEKLDPMKHQAMSIVEAAQEPNTIVAVLQKGYTIADRLLRPALVTVAKEK